MHNSTPLPQTVFTFLDCESTSADIAEARIIEVSAKQVVNEQVCRSFSTLVNPKTEIPDLALSTTGIDNTIVQHPIIPSEKRALQDLCRFIGPNPIIVGDFPGFDIALLHHRLDKLGLPQLKNSFNLDNTLCTRKLAEHCIQAGYFPEVPPTLKITPNNTMAYNVGRNFLYLPMRKAHRAEQDVDNTRTVFYALLKALQANDKAFNTVGELRTYQGSSDHYRNH